MLRKNSTARAIIAENAPIIVATGGPDPIHLGQWKKQPAGDLVHLWDWSKSPTSQSCTFQCFTQNDHRLVA